MKMKTIDEQVFNGIRKTINRFREKPFNYFTEADIHSSLLNDIMTGGSDVLSVRKNNISISLVHQEYPTNFRFKKKQLLEGYNWTYNEEETSLNSKKGARGNFDLAILNPEFIDKSNIKYPNEYLYHLINKDAEMAKIRMRDQDTFKKELLYAIEVKFIHYRNARHKAMIEEIIKDNEKLRLAHCHSNGFINPINLIFCSSEKKERSDKKIPVIEKIKSYVQGLPIELYDKLNRSYERPIQVLMIFTESFIDIKGKTTTKPIANFNNNNMKWAQELINIL